MKIEGNKYIFENDDELTDFCMNQNPSFYETESGLSYYDYEMTPEYEQAVKDGVEFVVLDPNSRAVKNGHINRGLITKCVDCYGPDEWVEHYALFDLRDYKPKEIVKPKDKEELQQIIEDTIEKEDNECDLNFIDTSEITDMSFLFNESDFNGDISFWDVSNVTNMRGMFKASSFNGDISDWDVSNVNDMTGMFRNSQFGGDISEWVKRKRP